MSQAEDTEPLSTEELTKILADATGTESADIDKGAEEFEIGPPEEAEVIGASDPV